MSTTSTGSRNAVSPRWKRATSLLVCFALAVAAAVGMSTATASAAPTAPRADVAVDGGARVVSVTPVEGRLWNVTVYSPSMDRVVPIQVLRPVDTSAPRPVLYLLNGASGGEDPTSNWADMVDIDGFFADKNVNVAIPKAGSFTYYTDWQNPDPKLGINKWTTFLTKELPPVLDASLGATGKQAIAGISTSGSAVLMLAINAPQLYSSVGAFSGCASTSDPAGQAFVNLVVEARGGADTANMWGPSNGPGWPENDAIVQADRLPRIPYYISSGSGLPGFDDTLSSPKINGNVQTLIDRVTVGGGIEAVTNACTHQLATRMNQLGIPATFDFPPNGTHSWAYWDKNLRDAWPMLGGSIGA